MFTMLLQSSKVEVFHWTEHNWFWPGRSTEAYPTRSSMEPLSQSFKVPRLTIQGPWMIDQGPTIKSKESKVPKLINYILISAVLQFRSQFSSCWVRYLAASLCFHLYTSNLWQRLFCSLGCRGSVVLAPSSILATILVLASHDCQSQLLSNKRHHESLVRIPVQYPFQTAPKLNKMN